MSRVGNKKIELPESVSLTQTNGLLTISGEKGQLEVPVHPLVKVDYVDQEVKVSRINETKLAKSLHGLTRALIANAVEGVTKGYTKKLEIVGVGYRARVEDENLILKVGFSHEVVVEPKNGVSFEVKKNTICVNGIDKQAVGQMAAEIRKIKKPEPYKGKGIKYADEKIIRKVGKAVKGAGA